MSMRGSRALCCWLGGLIAAFVAAIDTPVALGQVEPSRTPISVEYQLSIDDQSTRQEISTYGETKPATESHIKSDFKLTLYFIGDERHGQRVIYVLTRDATAPVPTDGLYTGPSSLPIGSLLVNAQRNIKVETQHPLDLTTNAAIRSLVEASTTVARERLEAVSKGHDKLSVAGFSGEIPVSYESSSIENDSQMLYQLHLTSAPHVATQGTQRLELRNLDYQLRFDAEKFHLLSGRWMMETSRVPEAGRKGTLVRTTLARKLATAARQLTRRDLLPTEVESLLQEFEILKPLTQALLPGAPVVKAEIDAALKKYKEKHSKGFLQPALAELELALTAKIEGVRPANPDDFVKTMIGKPAPDFTLKDVRGESVTLSSLKGRVVLLNFWGAL